MTPKFSLATASTADCMRAFGGVSPMSGRGVFANGRHRNARDIEKFLQHAGFNRREARALISGGFKAVSSADPEVEQDMELVETLSAGFRLMSSALRGDYHG